MKITPGLITSFILGLILVGILFSVAGSAIPTAATTYHNLSDSFAANPGIYGTQAATFGGNTDDYAGWFWVLAPFLILVSVVLGLVYMGKRRGSFRRGRR